jgi:hypothetical protein
LIDQAEIRARLAAEIKARYTVVDLFRGEVEPARADHGERIDGRRGVPLVPLVPLPAATLPCECECDSKGRHAPECPRCLGTGFRVIGKAAGRELLTADDCLESLDDALAEQAAQDALGVDGFGARLSSRSCPGKSTSAAARDRPEKTDPRRKARRSRSRRLTADTSLIRTPGVVWVVRRENRKPARRAPTS